MCLSKKIKNQSTRNLFSVYDLRILTKRYGENQCLKKQSYLRAGKEKGYRVVLTIIISLEALFVPWSQVIVAKQNDRLTGAQKVGSFIPHMMVIEAKAIALIAMINYVEREVVSLGRMNDFSNNISRGER